MKKVLFSLFAGLLVLSGSQTQVLAQTPAPQLKIAVIDLQRAFNEYYKTKDAEGMLKDRAAGFQKERDEMMADYQKMVDDTQKLKEASDDKTLSDAARQDRQNAFQVKLQDLKNKERQIQEFNVTRSKQFEDQTRRIRGGIVDEINKYLADLGAKEKYSLILDKAALSVGGTPVVLYSQDVKDITDDVIKAINASKPAAGAASTPPAAK